MRTCSGCRLDKPDEAFSRKWNSSGLRAECKLCACYRAKKRRDADKPGNYRATRNSFLRIKYGITFDEFEALLKKQGGVCQICHNECASGRRLAVDHNHSTGKVRGLLCALCNMAIGKFRDNPTILRRAADYLEQISQQASADISC